MSAALRKILERTDPQHFGKLITNNTEHFVERHVTLAQFYSIVKRLVQLHEEGVHPDDIVHLFDAHSGEKEPQKFNTTYSDDDLTSGGEEEAKFRGDGGQHHPQQRQPRSAEVEEVDQVQQTLKNAQNTRMAMRRSRSTGRSDQRDSDEQQYRKGLKSVASKIAPVVQFDRRRHRQATAKRDNDALKTVAQRRVDALTSTAVPLGFKDRHYFSEPKLFHSKPSVHSDALAQAVLHKTAPPSSSSYKRYSDLSSGLATMEIADAFLQGDVGREMLSTPECDYQSFPGDDPRINPAAAQRTASVLLGLDPSREMRSSYKEEVIPSRSFPAPRSGDARFAPNAQYGSSGAPPRPASSFSASANGREHISSITGGRINIPNDASTNSVHISSFATAQDETNLFARRQHQRQQQQTAVVDAMYGHRTVQERRTEQHLNETAKRLYEAPGWRSAQGGWAADFGPPHTHALYTGPEVSYSSGPGRGMKTNGSAQEERVETESQDVLPKPWRVRDPTSVSFKHTPADMNTTNKEDHTSAALESARSDKDSLVSEHRRNEAEIDEQLLRSSAGLYTDRTVTTSATASARNTEQHYEIESNNSYWDDSNFSMDSAVAGAGAGAAVRDTTRRTDAAALREQAAQLEHLQSSTGKQENEPAADNYEFEDASEGNESGDGSSGSGLGDYDYAAAAGGHFNPFAEDSSGDDAEYAAALDDSFSLSAAAARM